MTGVPVAIASTTDSPNGSAKAIGCSSACAEPRTSARCSGPDRTEVDDPVAVDVRLDASPK